jgi:hypothetical protein
MLGAGFWGAMFHWKLLKFGDLQELDLEMTSCCYNDDGFFSSRIFLFKEFFLWIDVLSLA